MDIADHCRPRVAPVPFRRLSDKTCVEGVARQGELLYDQVIVVDDVGGRSTVV